MNKQERKERRLELANLYIAAISHHGRQFYSHQGKVSFFLFCPTTGRIKLKDKYTGAFVDVQGIAWKNWKGFIEGGTLRNVIERLRDFILGKRKAPRYTYQHWGYNQEAIQALNEELEPILKEADSLDEDLYKRKNVG